MFPHNELENAHHEKPHVDDAEQIKNFQAELHARLDEQLEAKNATIDLIKKNLERARNET